MGILANALPGVRDLRAPLLAGYAWLLCGWLLFNEQLSTHEHRYVRETVNLAHSAGALWTAAAISVVAYLVGLLSRDLSRLLLSMTRHATRLKVEERGARVPATRGGTSTFLDEVLRRYFALVIVPFRALLQLLTLGAYGGSATGISVGMLSADIRFSLDRSDPIVRGLVEDRAREASALLDTTNGNGEDNDGRRAAVQAALRDLTDGLRRELDLPATLLVGARPELFAEADRIRAESELRAAFVPPLLALAGLLAANDSWLWLWALLPIGQLLMQGVRREDDVRRLIGRALLFGHVESAAVKRFDGDLERIIRTAFPAKTG